MSEQKNTKEALIYAGAITMKREDFNRDPSQAFSVPLVGKSVRVLTVDVGTLDDHNFAINVGLDSELLKFGTEAPQILIDINEAVTHSIQRYLKESIENTPEK